MNKNKKNFTKKEHETIKHIEKIIDKKMKKNKATLEKHPILFGFLGTIGVVAVFVGIEEVVKQIPFIQHNPYLLILFGVMILSLTGALYRILD